MTATRLIVGPFNRVEGDLEVRLEVSHGRVAAAFVTAPLFRGFERMMRGKDPRDALTITPRICGICSISQSAAAAAALAAAQGLTPAPEGARLAALLHAAENAADHLTHFALFFMPDFARPAYAGRPWHGAAVARFAAQAGEGALAALAARAALLHVVGILAGKWPHTLAIQPGGVTRAPGAAEAVRIGATLRAFRRYLEGTLFGGPCEGFAALATPAALMGWEAGDAGLFLRIAADLDLGGLGAGPGRYLSFGAYALPEGHAFARGLWDGALAPVDTDDIAEDVSHAWMRGETAHPFAGATDPDERMGAPGYTWCKAPRLAGRTAETGALARQAVDGHPLARALAAAGGSVLARVAARLVELARLQPLMESIARGIDPAAPCMVEAPVPAAARGAGLVEAARGALGHWVTVEGGRIAGYQIIAPTTWNFSPRDAGGAPGPLEQALVGAPVEPGEDAPLTVQHIVRSFDPCMVCTVH